MNAAHNRILDFYRERWRYLTLPPLYAEIMDIQWDDDDAGSLDADVDDDADDYDTKLFDWPSFTSRSSGKNLVNVDTFGAAGDGVSDDTQVRFKSFC